MKLRLTLLALTLILTLCACDAPLWANFEIFIKDASGDIVDGPHYCINWDRRGVMFSCQQPESVKMIELEDEDHTLQVWRVNQVMP